MRPSRDSTFMAVAQVLAKHSTCLRGQLGAVLVKDNRIISTGWNGAPAGMKHCLEEGCIEEHLYVPVQGIVRAQTPQWKPVESGCKRAIHAEANAIAYAARAGIATEGSTLYCTYTPCLPCAQLMLSAGVERVVAGKVYRDVAGLKLLDRASVLVQDIDGNRIGVAGRG